MIELKKTHEYLGHISSIYAVDSHENYIYSTSGDKFVARWLGNEGLQDSFAVKLEEVAYSIKLINDGKILLIGTSKGNLHLIDTQNKNHLKNIAAHNAAIFSIFEIPNHSSVIVTGDANGTLMFWNKNTFELLQTSNLNCGKIRNISFSENQLLLATQTGKILIYDLNELQLKTSFLAHENGANFIKKIPNKKAFISGGKDGLLKIWDLNFNEVLSIPAHNFAIYNLLFFTEIDVFVTVSRDKSIKLWKLSTLEFITKVERKHFGHSHSINDLAKISSNSFVTVGDDKRIITWELEGV